MTKKNQNLFLGFFIIFAFVLILLTFMNNTTRFIALVLVLVFAIVSAYTIVRFRKRQKKIKNEYMLFKLKDDSTNLHKNIDKYISTSIFLTEKEFGYYLKFMTYLKEDKLEKAREYAPKISPDRAFYTNYYLYLLEFSEGNYSEADKIYIQLNELRGNFNDLDRANLKEFTEIIDEVEKGTLWEDTATLEKLKYSNFLFLHRLALKVPLHVKEKY